MHRSNKYPRILILGAGCTGLGAAYRLHELGYSNFLVLEQNPYPGGLAASFVDDRGFTWDLGGHVQFSHYEYFDSLMDLALGGAWLEHVRQSYIWIRGRFVPYPFQNNFRHLPPDELESCLNGLIEAQRDGHCRPSNFREWIVRSFGKGIADVFLFPYNFKVWAHPLEMMDYKWVGERVATVDVHRILQNVACQRDDPAWGPNSIFRFPARGGTGAIWKAVAALIPDDHLRFNNSACRVDLSRRRVHTTDGAEYPYDFLISTLPLDILTELTGHEALKDEAGQLRYSTTHVVGIGLSGQPPDHLGSKSWLYFPEEDCPFYRVTVFSNYSPANVPDPSCFWSLMAEVSESPFKQVNRCSLVEDVIRGMLATRLVRPNHEIVSVWQWTINRGYPVPTADRDGHVESLLSSLARHGAYSRGRFGAWKYEVANQDHTCMQGVEAVNRVLLDEPELTVNDPVLANQAGKRGLRWPSVTGAAPTEHVPLGARDK